MRQVLLQAILALCFLASLASAQQTAHFTPGDPVDFNNSGKWLSCTVSSALPTGAYDLRCGTLETKADPAQLRAHNVAANVFAQTAAQPEPVLTAASLGARYGTREPRTCDRHKSSLDRDDVKELFICDAEREFGGHLFLVSNVAVDLVHPRNLSPGEMSGIPNVDRTEPIYNLRANYDKYQCTPIPRDRDYPNIRNCSEVKVSNASGGCYKSTSGDWHCIAYNADSLAASATEVKPPTLTD